MVAEYALPEDDMVARAAALLGGPDVLDRDVRTRLGAHELLRAGLPVAALERVLSLTARDGPARLDEDEVLTRALGLSRRTYQRWKLRDGPVSADAGNRIWMLASLIAQAEDALGSRAAALEWFARPALALDGRTPLSLLETPAGQELVRQALIRIDQGVYT